MTDDPQDAIRRAHDAKTQTEATMPLVEETVDELRQRVVEFTDAVAHITLMVQRRRDERRGR